MTVSHFCSGSSGLFRYVFADGSVSWVMTDYDATAHITEEMRNPAVKAPISILAALGSTYVLGFFLNIAVSVCMGPNWPDLLLTPTGLPFAQILYNVLGNKGGVAFMALAASICNFTGASCLQAQARTLFALGRGNCLVDPTNCRRDVTWLKILAQNVECYQDAGHLSMGQCAILCLPWANRLGILHSHYRHLQCISRR